MFFLESFLKMKYVLTALIPLELGIIAYKDLTSRNTKCELSGIFSIIDFS